MSVHKITRGLDLPITGAPNQVIQPGPSLDCVAIVAADYPYMRPRMLVEVGQSVRRGEPLFEDRKTEGVSFCAPGAGKVRAVHRGERRALLSVVIELSATEAKGQPSADDHMPFPSWAGGRAGSDASALRGLLTESGMITAFRQRPFGKVPPPQDVPAAVFITAIDTNPFAPDVDVVMAGRQDDFQRGVAAVSLLTEGPTFVCKGAQSQVSASGNRVRVESFAGPHPAGLPGTHIHTLFPASRERVVWHIGYQDVMALGRLLATGQLDVDRVVSVAGPPITNGGLVRTRLGASLGPLVQGKLPSGESRVISGSVLSGRTAQGAERGYLGRYDSIVSCLLEDRKRVLFGWFKPGGDRFSLVRAFASALTPRKRFPMTTTTWGSHRAMVPIGMYEQVMPLDILPTFLLRALLSNDLERGEQLGALELIEEDLGLCSFVCPGNEDYGAALRRNLDAIWKEG